MRWRWLYDQSPEREGKPFPYMIPHGGDRRFVDPQRWFYCGGDSDLDSLD